MADTGFVLCTAATDLGDVPNVGWGSVGNIVSSNDVRANWSASSAKNADTLKAFTFNLNIPSGATIDGVETQVEAHESAGSVTIGSVNIGKTDATLGTAKTPGDGLTSSDANYVHGGPADLWGLSLSETEVEASTFQVRYVFAMGASSTVQVDAVWVKVYYTEPAGNTAGSASGAGTLEAVANSVVSAAFSAAGTGAATAVGGTSNERDAAASISGTGTATFIASSTTNAAASAGGSATTLAVPESSGLEVPDFTPVGGGGGFGPTSIPGKQRFRMRKEKSHPKVITVRIGDWPEDPQIILERQETAEREAFHRSLANRPDEVVAEHIDEDEQALLEILAFAA